MNIYLHVEISSRELDSKLLLATLAASRGHKVIVSDIIGIEKGVKNNVLAPGIFHTKSLSAHKIKISRHKTMIDKGFMITSLDEEGNLNDYGYDGDAKTRFSDQTIKQSTAVFGWGEDDVDTLKKVYPNHSHKIYKTGSPRADLWKPLFSDYWNIPSTVPNKPFLLISCNTGYANNINPFGKLIKFENEMGRYQSNPKHLEMNMGRYAEDFNKMLAYVEAIKHLSAHNNGYDIVLRPHPAEDIEAWKIILSEIPNVHVIRDGPIDAWVKKAFAVMHNSCTTALEATISNKPLVTYVLPGQKYSPQLANELGHRVKSLEELLNKVNTIFDSSRTSSNQKLSDPLPSILSKKIFFDNELAAEKIIKIWENIDNDKLSNFSNMKKFEWILRFDKFKKSSKNILKRLLPVKLNFTNKNSKFTQLNQDDISKRIEKLGNILGLSKKLECKLLSEKTIYIKNS